MTTAMLMRGTRKHTRQQLQDEFDRLKARININSWGSGIYLHVETTRENLPAVLALVAEVLREPAFDPKELEQLRAEMARGYRAAAQRSVGARLHRSSSRHLKPYPKGDIRYVGPSTKASPRSRRSRASRWCSSTAISSARSRRSSRRSATSTPPPSRSRWRSC